MTTAEEIRKYRGTPTEGFFEDKADQHQFVIGDTVYRAGHLRIEQGVVIRIERINLDSQGHSRGPAPDGEYVETTAQFGTNYEEQTYCWKFFPRIEEAFDALIKQVQADIRRHQHDIAKLEKLVAQAEAKSAPQVRFDEKRRVIPVEAVAETT